MNNFHISSILYLDELIKCTTFEYINTIEKFENQITKQMKVPSFKNNMSPFINIQKKNGNLDLVNTYFQVKNPQIKKSNYNKK